MKKPWQRIIGDLIIFWGLCVSCSVQAELKAGLASVDITPDPSKMKITLGGYGARMGKKAKGVNDPIYAKAMVVESDDKKFTLVAIDLVEVSNELRQAVLKKLEGTDFNTDNLFISATHTHSAPGAIENIIIAEIVFGAYSQKLVDFLADGIVQAIKQADARLTPIELKFAQADIPGFTRNRRVLNYNYDTRRFGAEDNLIPNKGITDDTLSLIRLDDKTGQQIGVIVHFATHPTILGADNFLISSDWPGVMRKKIEANYPQTVVMFLNGAEGDQAPVMPATEDDFQAMEIFGKKLAEKALPLIESAVRINSEPVSYKIEWRKINYPAMGFGVKFPKPLTQLWFGPMPFGGIRMGEMILLTAPVEAISEIGMTIKQSALGFGYKYPIYVGLTNDHFLYCTTAEEYKKGGYEADSTMWGELEAGMMVGEMIFLARELSEVQ